MPIFHLKPISRNLDDAAWSTCTFRSECWVNADDEGAARGIASGKFQDGGATITGLFAAPSPWRDPGLVEAVIVPDAPAGMTIPKDSVVASS